MINRIKRKWLPTTLAELAVWYANFALKLADYAGVLGISAATLAQVNQDNETVQWAARADGVSEANGRGFRDFRDLLIYGVRNTPLPEFPPTDLPTPPERLSVAIVDRLVRLVDTIEDADGFNDDTASALGIQSPVSERLPESEWKPVLIVDEEMAFRLLVEFKKGDSDGLTLYQQVGDSADWEKVGTYPKSPIELTITPPVANQPVAVKLKGCFIKNNKPVGEMSSVSETVARP